MNKPTGTPAEDGADAVRRVEAEEGASYPVDAGQPLGAPRAPEPGGASDVQSEAAAPVPLDAERETLTDEVTPPIAVAPRAPDYDVPLKFIERELEVTQEISAEELELQPLAPSDDEPPPTSSSSLAQVALSDLFDAAPPPGSVTLEPPNVAEFSSSRPPPGAAPPRRAAPSQPAAARAPSSPGAAARTPSQPAARVPSQPGATARPPSQPPAASRTPSSPTAALPRAGSARVPSAPTAAPSPVRSSPTLAEASPAASAPARDSTPAAAARIQSPGPATPRSAPTAAPSPAEPAPVGSRPPRDAAAASAGKEGAARRPLRAASPPTEPQSFIAAPASRQSQQPTHLPSVVLDPSIAPDAEQANLKAIRSMRATVRLSSAAALSLLRSAPPPSGPVSSGPAISVRPLSPASIRALGLGGNKRKLGLVAGALLLVSLLVWLLLPSTGTLVVTVSGPGGAPVEGVRVFVDSEPVCDSSPCQVADLEAGVHFVRASALGMADIADETVSIEAGKQAVHNVRLSPPGNTDTGGIQVNEGDEPLTLSLDGKVIGPLPQKVMGLSPGEHWLEFHAMDGSEPFEKRVVVGAGEIREVVPTRPRSDKVIVTIQLSRDSEGASVTLDEDFLLDFPAELELLPNQVYELKATKAGFKDYATKLHVTPGDANKVITIDLDRSGSARSRSGSRSTAAARRAAAAAKAKRAASAASAEGSATPAATASGLLNINSTPPSSVILNGRPIGTTPRVGVQVPGGSMQTIIFVHPQLGRRRVQQIVPPGKTKTVSIRF